MSELSFSAAHPVTIKCSRASLGCSFPMRSNLPGSRPARALDVATGTGAAARAAAEIVGAAGHMVAGDIARPMLKQACRNLQAHAITLVAPDGQRLPLKDGSFDAVTCHFGLMFLSDPLQGLSEFRRVLGDGGRATISFTSTIPERTLHNRVSIANDMEALIGSGSR
jgi:ubiquinone/menaquinone biosynthesis C-methylase UbiE